MRFASFFVLSLALHATVLVFPLSFYGRADPAQLIYVTILPMKQESFGAGRSGGSGNSVSRAGSKSAARTSTVVQPSVESKRTGDPEPQVISGEAPPKLNDDSLALFNATPTPATTGGAGTFGSTDANAQGQGLGGNGGVGGGVLGSSGTGHGSGNGYGSSETDAILIQARYSEIPKPEYPKSARSEGREGRVLLRVLVDDQGRSKHVEINASSGSEALDRAAAEAIKRGRFHPARYGDKPVESWLRIPIEFRLADANSR